MSDQYEARISSQGVLHFDNVDGLGNENIFDIDEEDFLDVYPLTARQRLIYNCKRYGIRVWKRFQCLPNWKKMMVILLGLIGLQAAFVMVFFRKQILEKVVQLSNELNSRWYTPFIFISLIFGVSFPPLVGFSLLSTCVGLVYGITLKGWLIISFGAVSGSIAAFIVYKTVLQSYAERLVRWNDKFEALASILQDNDSYWLIALIRLCPFPYSLTNGAMAGIYGISVRNFSIAQVITTPKLVIYLFIGSWIKNIGETDSTTEIIFDIVGIIITVISLAVTTSLLYYKTKNRYLELQRRGDDPFATASF